ncbi:MULTISPECIES: SDR family oxidoreductase [Micromonospora]|uniref:Short-chain dehydrogenase n=1 Tax=Micromonospora sicca TaxID=2202420 RepID=A0A317DA52_9ACTN|nr:MULTISPECIES: SDR family oxidoreductase [unclassified Micromonospora]MBM0225386.1 SDR family oxidoreductase [Micromonospora sp. ATA51]PWR11761.1 short-chain dehydrogenase [Micromonospora sp. 4G51]
MQIEGSVALVTGANRGIGRALAQELVDRGASKVYAAARHPEQIDLPGVVPLRLDITTPEQVAEAARVASDTTLLINNAGVTTYAPLVTGDLSDIRREMDTNFLGTLSVVRAFAPVLAANGGGAILNVLSVMAWLGYEHSNGYGASKAALWALTNGVRVELASQGTQVTGLVLASTDTDMMAGFDVPKNRPEDVARAALDGVDAGRLEVLADADSVALKAALSRDPSETYPKVVGAA